jgi:hypothetical protein
MLPLVRVRQMAYLIGILLPLAETVRRSGSLAEWWLWADDYLIGVSLLAAARLSRDRSAPGERALAAAWGLTCGMGYYSLVGHLLRIEEADVSGLPGWVVPLVIGVGLAIAIWSLISIICAPLAREDSGLRRGTPP